MTCIASPLTTPFPANVLQSIPENNDELGHEITRLSGHINAANYRFLKLLAALVERKAWTGHGIKSPAHWLNYYCGISLGPGREKVRVAKCLASLPLIDEAFGKGEISYAKVRAMTRAATPDNEHYLLMIARHGTASHVEKLVRKYAQVKRLSSADQAGKQQEERSFSCHYDDDGMLVFNGRLAPEAGALFLKAMDAVLHAMNEKNVSAETFPQKRADAMVRMAEQSLAAAKGEGSPVTGGDKYQVVVHVDATSGRNAVAPQAHIEDGPVLSPQTVRRLASDASLVTVLEDGKGNVLNVGRKSRTVPPAIRRALALRDRGCRFPGCCEAKYVDAHHIRHWCDGGETSLDNLVLLCRRHHRLVHEAGYGIAKDGAGGHVFLTPAGRPMDQARFPQFPTAAENVSAETFLAIERQHEELGLEIDERTAVTAWRGETMDYGLAVDALLGHSIS